LAVGSEEQQADAAGDATAAGGGLDDLIEHGLEAELDRVQSRQLAKGVDDALRVTGHGRSLGKRRHRRCCASPATTRGTRRLN
jgi:hypothetical protein